VTARRRLGRPPKYDPGRVLPIARAMAKLGATDQELAIALQVSITTISLWARTHKEFLKAIKPAKRTADDRVEQSLYRRANGYEFDSEDLIPYDHITTVTRTGADGKPEEVTIREKRVLHEPTVKKVPPDTTAAIFWLKNRRKDRWRDFKATELSTPPGRPLEFSSAAPGEPELIGAYFERLKRAEADPAPRGAARPDPGADPGVGEGGPEPSGPRRGKAPRQG
jgi:hypothetical protein